MTIFFDKFFYKKNAKFILIICQYLYLNYELNNYFLIFCKNLIINIY